MYLNSNNHMQQKKIVSLSRSILLLASSSAAVLQSEYCLGYSQVIGVEGKQVTDDVIHAVQFKDMIEKHPDFNFSFNILSKFEYDTAVDMHDKTTEWVHSAALSIYLKNWADFVVEKNKLGEDLEKLRLTDFAADVHGDIDVSDEVLSSSPLGAPKGFTATQVHFDKMDTITAIKFETLDSPVQSSVVLGESEMENVVQAELPQSPTTSLIGFRTTRKCHQARTI